MINCILYPFVTEKTIGFLDKSKLQVICDIRSNKKDIKKDIEKLYGYKVLSINTMMTSKGKKKAIITFENKDAANEISTKLGII